MFSTRRRPHLNEDKREGDPTAAEAEDDFRLPEFGQFQIAHFVNYVRSILKQDCSIDALKGLIKQTFDENYKTIATLVF